MRARDVEQIAARSILALLDSVSPIKNLTSASERHINWRQAGEYFDGMADPYKVFEFRAGGRVVQMSTAELMKIERSSYQGAQRELSAVLSELQDAGVVSNDNPWLRASAIGSYRHLGQPAGMLESYPMTNDVYMPDTNKRVEGMAIPRSVTPMYLTPRVLDPGAISDESIVRVLERIYAAVATMHSAANANASLSPAVHIALNRLGTTDAWLAELDRSAASQLVPKSARVPEIELLRGCWADNQYFGDLSSDRSLVYSSKNAYLPGLGNARDTRVPELFRDGPLSENSTRFVNPCFPEFLRPIHFATIPRPGSPAGAGLTISGPSDARWKHSLATRAPVWTFSDAVLLTPTSDGVAPRGDYPGGSGWWSGHHVSLVDIKLSHYRTSASRIDETDGPYGVVRRLRDWYYANKPKCGVYVADAITDLAAAVQLARFLVDMPPHVLLHSVMGTHSALLKLSFRQVDVPYSTAIDQYELRMRMEREAIAANAARFGLIGHGTTEPGYALTVKAPDSVILADAGLQAATVGSLTAAIAVTAANPVAGVVCIALVGCAILIAELSGGRAQNLVTPRDRSKEELRSERNNGIRSNWFRGITPEFIVNAEPVLRT